jgi:excisionase family DNA binding protein
VADVPSIMNKRQLAEYLDVGTSTVERWRTNEGLPYVRIGGVTRYRRAAIDEWIADRETAHTPAPVETVARRRRSNG